MVAMAKQQAQAEYAVPITFEEWLLLPVDSERTELLNGELVVSPLSYRRHQEIQSALGGQFHDAIKLVQGAKLYYGLNVRASGMDGLIPDLALFTGKAGGELTDYGVSGPVDLVVEILSPSNRSHDLITKAAEYAKLGVPEYWIVDPVKSMLILGRLANGTYERTFYTEGTVTCEALDGAKIGLGFLKD